MKCSNCGRELVLLVNGFNKNVVCELCNLNMLTLTKCDVCGLYYDKHTEKSCKCRKLGEEK